METSPTEVRELLLAGWWWIDRPNPPCRRWCTIEHDEFELATSQGFMCARPAGHGPGWVLTLLNVRYPGDEPDTWGEGSDDVTVQVCGEDGGVADVAAEDVDIVADALRDVAFTLDVFS